MGDKKISEFFLRFKANYDAKQVRNARMDRFLDNAEKTEGDMRDLTYTVKNLGGQIAAIGKKMDSLQERVDHIDNRLMVIGKGTKIELFDTLYHWKKILVDERGWASEAEKKEVKRIYEVYHDGLDGNGEGKYYFEQIIQLPETPPAK